MDRRSLLKTVGGIGVTASAAGAGVLATTGSAAAASVNFNVNPVAYTSADGELSAVLVDVDGTVSWEGFDSGASDYDVSLQAAEGGGNDYTEIATTNVSSLGGAKNSNGVDFDLDPVDLTETSKFDDSDFGNDNDGTTKSIDVEIKVVVTINTEDGSSHSDEGGATITVDHTNKAASASADTDATATVAFAGDVYETNKYNTDPGDDAYLEFDFSQVGGAGNGTVVMVQRLGNWNEKLSSSSPANSPIGFDINEDGSRDFQVGWRPGESAPEFGVKDPDGSSWEDVSGVSDISINESETDTSSGYIVWEINSSLLNLSDDGTFRAGGNATAGGEDKAVKFCDDASEGAFTPENMLIVSNPNQ